MWMAVGTEAVQWSEGQEGGVARQQLPVIRHCASCTLSVVR